MTSSISSKSITDRDALRVLNAVPGFGNRRITQLIEYFGSAEDVLSAPARALSEAAGIPQAAVLNLKSFKVDEFLLADSKAVRENDARVVTVLDEEYPEQL